MIAVTLITIPSLGTANLIEIIWLLSGLMAIGFTLAHMRELGEDYADSVRSTRIALRAVAWGYLRREIVRFSQGVLITVIGAYSCWADNPAPGPVKVTPVGLLLTAVFFGLGILVSAQSYWDWRIRCEVQHLIVEENGLK